MTGLLIGIGANLSPDGYATPRDGCEAAIARLPERGISVRAVSTWYETAPVPLDQPWFNNGHRAETMLAVEDTLLALRDRGAFRPGENGQECRPRS